MAVSWAPVSSSRVQMTKSDEAFLTTTKLAVAGTVYDEAAKQMRENTVTTHYSAEDNDDYVYDVELQLACTHCDFCEKHRETWHHSENQVGGHITSQERVEWVKK